MAVALAATACAGTSTPSAQPSTTAAPPTSPPPSSSSTPTATSTATAAGPDLRRFYTQHLSWHGCSGGFQCATMLVPLDYAHPEAGTLKVAVTRHRSTSSHRGSLVINPGGPGASGVQFAHDCFACFSALTPHYDLASFDPRGVGATRPVRCLSAHELDAFFHLPPYLDNASDRKEFFAGYQHFVAGCEQRNGSYLRHIGTIDSARDMDVFRALLGDSKLTYYGASYGTFLGAKYAQLFPTHIRALVLDGAVDPAQDNLADAAVQARGFEVDLQDFLANCANSGSCPLGDTPAAAMQGFDTLQKQIAAHPERVGSRVMGPSEFIGGVAQGMYATSEWSYLRKALQMAKNGDGSGMLLFFDALVDRNSNGGYSNLQEAFNAISCIDRPSPKNFAAYDDAVKKYVAQAPHFAAPIIYPTYACALWPVPPVETNHPVSAPGAPPILVVGTTHDPATPYAWAQALARELSGVLLTLSGSGHTAYLRHDGCIDRVVNAYVLTAHAPKAGTRCS